MGVRLAPAMVVAARGGGGPTLARRARVAASSSFCKRAGGLSSRHGVYFEDDDHGSARPPWPQSLSGRKAGGGGTEGGAVCRIIRRNPSAVPLPPMSEADRGPRPPTMEPLAPPPATTPALPRARAPRNADSTGPSPKRTGVGKATAGASSRNLKRAPAAAAFGAGSSPRKSKRTFQPAATRAGIVALAAAAEANGRDGFNSSYTPKAPPEVLPTFEGAAAWILENLALVSTPLPLLISKPWAALMPSTTDCVISSTV